MRQITLKACLALFIALLLTGCGLAPLPVPDLGTDSRSSTVMTVEEVVAAAKAGELTTFEQIGTAMDVVIDNRPQLTSEGIDKEDKEAEEKALDAFLEAARAYDGNVMWPFIEALEGMRVTSWHGWVVATWRDRTEALYNASVNMMDPYSDQMNDTEQLSKTRSLRTITLSGLAADDAEKLHAGDEITFSATIYNLDPTQPYIGLSATTIESQQTSTGMSESSLADLVITLERTVCFGECPSYTLTIYGDGRVLYEGREHVLAFGKRVATIGETELRRLVYQFEKAGFFALAEEYPVEATDSSSAITSIRLSGRHKTIYHSYSSTKAPMKLLILERLIDEAANSKQWTGK